MNALGLALAWCAVQVTAVSLAAGLACAAAGRRDPAGRSLVGLAAMLVVVGLSFLALSPWPRWGAMLQEAGPVSSPPDDPGARPRSAASAAPGTRPPALPPLTTAGSSAEPTAAAPVPADDRPNGLPRGIARDAGARPNAKQTDDANDVANRATSSGRGRHAGPWGAFRNAVRDGFTPRPLTERPPQGSSAEATSPWRRWPAVLAAWLLAGMAVGAVRFGAGLWGVGHCRRRSRPIDDPKVQELLDRLRAELGCCRAIELRESEEIVSAATTGWRRPVILLPVTWHAWSHDERRAVLAHELVHVERHDFAAACCAQLGVMLHFYHPLVHWLAGRLRLEQELAADAVAAGVCGGPPSYLRILAELALRQPDRPVRWPARAFLPTRHTFLRRIEMLRDTQRMGASRPRGRRLLAAGLVILAGLAASGLREPASGTENAPQAPLVFGERTDASVEDASADHGGAASADAPRTRDSLHALRQERSPAVRPAAGSAPAAVNGGEIELSWIPVDTAVIVAVRPAALAAQPELRAAARSVEGEFVEFLGVGLPQIEQITWIALRDAVENPRLPGYGAVMIRAAAPTDFAALTERLVPDPRERRFGDRTYHVSSQRGNETAYFRPDDRTILLDLEPNLKRFLISGEKPKSRLVESEAWTRIREHEFAAVVDSGWLASLVADGLRGTAFAAVAPFWEQTKELGLGLRIADGELHVEGVAWTDRADRTQVVQETFEAVVTLSRNALSGLRREITTQAPPAEQPLMLMGVNALEQLLMETRVEAAALEPPPVPPDVDEGIFAAGARRLVIIRSSTEIEGMHIAIVLDAIRAARAAADRTRSIHNLRRIALAFHNYHDVHNHFPPAVITRRGDQELEHPHSWRVAILPFVDGARLYNNYRFDEPWDSEHNRTILEQMPDVFRHPGDRPASTNASYFALKGPETVFDPWRGVPRMRDITDGTSNTILVVEAKRDIPWTKPDDLPFHPDEPQPDDLPFHPDEPLPELGGWHEGLFHAAMADGAVHAFSTDLPDRILRLLILPADGHPLPWDEIRQQDRGR